MCSAPAGPTLDLCEDCLRDLPWHDQPHCAQCALPALHGQTCGHCLKSPPAFDRTRALLRYGYPVDAMLQRYKYQHLLSMAHTFAGLMLHALPTAALPDLLIPMPLHAQRLKERGFNQALEIARIVAGKLALPLDMHSCTRTKDTAPQVSLPLKQRVKNMRGAFHCTEDLHGLRIALLDDVMTTSASLNALAKTVKAAGAAKVECWVIARTLPT
ncbi:MAG TPA: ComF family protein [Methylophilaceae bacterium]|nr:ComF family protein [Methylophilaceae bacterium]